MANIISKSFNAGVSPKGKAMWAKINSRIDEYEGKKKYSIDVIFDKDGEQKMLDVINHALDEAKNSPEYSGKVWRNDTDRLSYHDEVDKDGNETGNLVFHFQTKAFMRDRETGEEVQKIIPVFSNEEKRKLNKDESIGNGSVVRIKFTPSVYWMNKSSNGVNLYLSKIVVDKWVKFGGGDDDFSEFGIGTDDAFLSEDDIPI